MNRIPQMLFSAWQRARRAQTARGSSHSSGQAMIFILMVIVILAFVALWQFDLHKTLFVKYKSRNAGDAAALAAARWQAISLNLIGELNVMQAVSISQSLGRGDTNFVEAKAIGDLEARVAFTGPMVGFLAAEEAAKNNGMYVNSDYTREVNDHANTIRRDYLINYPDLPYHNTPEPPTAWDDYAQMVQEIADLGVAASPDNVKFYNDYVDFDHMLLNPSFYDAIATSDWCWFFFNAYNLLQTYTSYRDWPPLPIYNEPRPSSSEYFALGLHRVSRLADFGAVTFTNGALGPRDLLGKLDQLSQTQLDPGVITVSANWLFYRDDFWSAWTGLLGDDFPFRSDVKDEYNYIGADSAVRIVADVDRLTPGIQSADVTWSAAAKPFGTLEGPVQPSTYGLVLPGFTDVRLIPVDASTASPGGSHPNWGIHIHEHLPPYIQQGLFGLSAGCWYCQQLRTWEDPVFRADGLRWLLAHSSDCTVHHGGGGGGGGGSHRGH